MLGSVGDSISLAFSSLCVCAYEMPLLFDTCSSFGSLTHAHTHTHSLTHLSGGVWRAHPFVPYRTNKWHLSIKRIKRVHQKARLYLCAYENLFSLSFMCVCVPLPPLWWWFTCRAQHCYEVIKVLIAFAASSSFVMPYNRNYLGLCWNYWAALESMLWF